MTGTHLHLIINHVPILGAAFAALLLLVSLRYGAAVLQRTALALLIVVAIGGGTAKYSGEPAEDGVRGMPGVTRDSIEEHEELADKSFLTAAVLGVLALGILVRWRTTEIPRGAALTALAGSFVVAGMMGYTGLLGGQIRHTEVRTGATAADAIIIEAPRGSESDERER